MRTRRRVAVAVAGALAAAGLAACSSGPSGSSLPTNGTIVATGKRVPAPGVTGARFDGTGSVSLAALKGKVVVVNLFGSWCGPCKAETPGVERAYAATAPKGVQFVGLAELDSPGKLAAFLGQMHVTYPVVNDSDGSLAAKFGGSVAPVVPSTLLFDRQGRLAARFIAPVTQGQLQADVEALAAEPV